MPQVYYKRMIEGHTIPAIICNGGSYFCIDMPIYEDGTVDCWRRVSLADCIKEISKGWLVTEVPVGKSISIHGLGSYQICAASWQHTPESFFAHVEACVRQMNPEMIGLFEETPEQKARWEAYRVRWGASGKPYVVTGNFGYNISDGTSSRLFYRGEDGWQLSTITAYANQTFSVDGASGSFSLKDIRDMFASGTLSGNVAGAFQLLVPGLGSLRVQGDYQTEPGEKLKEIEDMALEMGGGKTSLELCRDRYVEYLIYPSDANRERLRIAYEAVPEHERMFLGDMDDKDRDYIRILYHPDVKREV